jgi:hypothetical protein
MPLKVQLGRLATAMPLRAPGQPVTLKIVSVGTSGIRQESIWASVVSDDASALRDWLLALGFLEDLLIPGEQDNAIHHCQLDWPEGGRVLLSSTSERPTPAGRERARCMS